MANLSGLDLNLLRVLDALLTEHSTVRAGRRVGLSQPAVSAALGRLRTSLGDQLFFRRGQGLEPTEYARSLEAPLRRILEDVEALVSSPGAFDPAASTLSFTVSGSDYFAELLMPELGRVFSKVAPQTRVHLVDLVPDRYVDTLEHGVVDLALMPTASMTGWIESRTVFYSSFSLIARKGHPGLAAAGIGPGGMVPLDLYCDLRHVMFSPEGRNSAVADLALARVGRSRNVVMTMPVFSGIYRSVAGSDLIALLPTALAERVAEAAGLDIFVPPVRVARAEIIMVWHRRYSSSPPHMWLRDQVMRVLQPLDEGPDQG
ncbi:LysR family transcriptional regulator [Amaricoccus tamworthensis]|uniref:LysR family transcriptional regulator n=1 Tax=Amaricoccus tamworthensis TaxID=57002 RepID=UPI003C7A654D